MKRKIMIATLLLMPVALTKDIGLVNITLWNIPYFALLGLRVTEFKGDPLSVRIRLWEAAIILLPVVALVSMVYAQMPTSEYPHWWQYSTALSFALVAGREYGKTFDIYDVVNVFLVILLIQSGISLLQIVTGTKIGNPGAYLGDVQSDTFLMVAGVPRIVGTMENPNSLGNLICILLPLALASPWLRRSTAYQGSVFLLAALTVVVTLSRASIFALFILSIVYGAALLYRFVRNSLRGRMLVNVNSVVLVMAVFFMATVLLIQSNIIQRATDFIDGTMVRVDMLDDASLSRSTLAIREEMNSRAVQAFLSSPVIGIGYRGTIYMWSSFSSSALSDSTYRVHNVYLALLAESGILAFLLYIMITKLPIYYVLVNKNLETNIKLSLILSISMCYFFSLVSLTMFTKYVTPLYMMLLGVAMALAVRRRSAPVGQQDFAPPRVAV